VLEKLLDKAIAGTLPDAAKWILNTQLTFLEKPGTDTPRPIRVGDHLRRMIGKRVLIKFAGRIRELMLKFQQFGVAMPGGSEALIHARETVEQQAALGLLGPIVVIDSDLVNCFGMFEWPSTAEAVNTHLPELTPWLEWCTSEADNVRLPCGEWVTSDRGTGQGEPEGPLKAAVTIGHAAEHAKADLEKPGAWWWFVDDGQMFVYPTRVDETLRALDARLHAAGASRGSRALGHKIKSTVRAYIPENYAEECRGWDTEYVRDTCTVLSDSDPRSKVLGVVLGPGVVDQFGSVMEKVVGLHKDIEGIQDSAVEVVLKSECAGISKAVHILRAAGDLVSSSDLQKWDQAMKVSLGRSLNGEIEDHSWRQAAGGFDAGGLNWKSASDLALPAFLASRIAARPAVRTLFQSIETAGFGDGALCMLLEAYDVRTRAAESALAATLPEDLAQRIKDIAIEGAEDADRRWKKFVQAGDDEQEQGPQVAQTEDPLLRVAMAADLNEPGADRSRHLAGPLQRTLSAVTDEASQRVWQEDLRERGRHSDLRRLAELQDKDNQERSWLWAIQQGQEPTLAAHDYALAVRTMLGASLLIQPVLCNGCGKHLLDVQGKHALCCMGSETTIGHNRIRDTVAMGLAMADPGTITEPLGLVPSRPELRPADILSRAGREDGLVACDIGVASPEAGGAGLDCLEAMRSRKLAHYGDAVLEELRAQHIVYTPLILSCYGRRSRVLSELLRAAASRAARTRDGAHAAALLARWNKAIACEVWRRTAAMVRRCLPKPVVGVVDSQEASDDEGEG
jgi:hypothetical protein